MDPIHIIGGGMAGSDAAWAAANAGVPVILHEMRPERGTEAHQTDGLAELVCSNSFRSDDDESNAVGLLHWEMRAAGSLVMEAAAEAKLPAGGALAVDRGRFSAHVTKRIESHPLITVERGEITGLPPEDWSSAIIATGPLTSPALADAIRGLTGEESLAFFDAIAPIVYADSVDMGKAWFQSRYDKGESEAERTAYLNCPLNRAQYDAFIAALLAAPQAEFHDWEKDTPYFEGCLPIEVMAARGAETLRFGPMKPIGLTNPHAPAEKPYAVVQLRRDNALGTLYNIVGFQTKMKYAAQAEALALIPGLETARFARLGGIHRNTFLNSPRLLDRAMRLRAAPRLRFAGQITGVEGYVESAAMGGLAGRFAAAERLGREMSAPPAETAHGALLAHITGGAEAETFQPMNVNFGLFPLGPAPGGRRGKAARKIFTPQGRKRRSPGGRMAENRLTERRSGAFYGERGRSGDAMVKKFLDDAYSHGAGEAAEKFYDAWAETYDEELAENGYVTPRRCARALAAAMPERNLPVLDLGCGTGLSGVALRAEGFSIIDGWDPSSEMLRRAEGRDAYRVLRQIEPDLPLSAASGAYAAVVAAGVLSPGLAPPEAIGQVLGFLPKGGHFCFSLNDVALADGAHDAAVKAQLDRGDAELVSREHGEHIRARALGADVIVLRKP